jgi:hypothetical protein
VFKTIKLIIIGIALSVFTVSCCSKSTDTTEIDTTKVTEPATPKHTLIHYNNNGDVIAKYHGEYWHNYDGGQIKFSLANGAFVYIRGVVAVVPYEGK